MKSDDARIGGLYEATSRDLLAFLLRRCATVEDAADCLAETYRIAWEKHARIPAGDEARPWLFGVARNVARRARTGEEQRTTTSRELALAASGRTRSRTRRTARSQPRCATSRRWTGRSSRC